MRTRVKICGITRVEDGIAAARLGADAIGLVFYAPSPRCVSIQQAQDIVSALPPFVSVVGLFVDAGQAEIEQTLQQLKLDLLQFHGDERPAECERYPLPYIKALRMKAGSDIAAQAMQYTSASGILLDSYQAGVPGGTGKSFDWAQIPSLHKPLILAGGLDAGNVAQAISTAQPFAVDVSGGVEAAKGIKDSGKMSAFITEVQRVETSKAD